MTDEDIKFKILSQAIEEDMTENELFEIARERRYRINDLQKENAELKAKIEEKVNLIDTQYLENQILVYNNEMLADRLCKQQEQIEKMKKDFSDMVKE